MAYKYREEIVGKRFLSVCSPAKLKFSKISEWAWRSGIVRATSHKDPKHPELSVLVEFDDADWKSREWLRLYQDDTFEIFLVENTLVWALRKETVITGSAVGSLYWPSLTFISLVDKAGLSDSRLQPVEYLVDKELEFVDYAAVLQYQDEDVECQPSSCDFAEVQKAIKQWTEYQDGQRILVTTPSVLVGYRVEVYRVEGTTQWYTAVIVSYNDNTRELTLTDDTVLEEHSEDPCLVQMKLIGDGVVESILKGENVGITPRRRTCTIQQQQQHSTTYPAHYSTRTRSHHSPSNLFNRLSLPPVSRRTRQRSLSSTSVHEIVFAGAGTISTVPDRASTSRHEGTSRGSSRRKSSDVAEGSGTGKRKQTSDGRKRNSRRRRCSYNKSIHGAASHVAEENTSRRSRASSSQASASEIQVDETEEIRPCGSQEPEYNHEIGAGTSESQVKEDHEIHTSTDGCSEIIVPSGENTSPKAEISKASSPKSKGKLRSHGEGKLVADSKTLPAAEEGKTSSSSVGNALKTEVRDDGESELSETAKSLPISSVSSVSVVLTPLSPSVVSAVVNCSTTTVCTSSPTKGVESTEAIEETIVGPAEPANSRAEHASFFPGPAESVCDLPFAESQKRCQREPSQGSGRAATSSRNILDGAAKERETLIHCAGGSDGVEGKDISTSHGERACSVKQDSDIRNSDCGGSRLVQFPDAESKAAAPPSSVKELVHHASVLKEHGVSSHTVLAEGTLNSRSGALLDREPIYQKIPSVDSSTYQTTVVSEGNHGQSSTCRASLTEKEVSSVRDSHITEASSSIHQRSSRPTCQTSVTEECPSVVHSVTSEETISGRNSSSAGKDESCRRSSHSELSIRSYALETKNSIRTPVVSDTCLHSTIVKTQHSKAHSPDLKEPKTDVSVLPSSEVEVATFCTNLPLVKGDVSGPNKPDASSPLSLKADSSIATPLFSKEDISLRLSSAKESVLSVHSLVAKDVSNLHSLVAKDVLSLHSSVAKDVLNLHSSVAKNVLNLHSSVAKDVSSLHSLVAKDALNLHSSVVHDVEEDVSRLKLSAAKVFSSWHSAAAREDFLSLHSSVASEEFLSQHPLISKSQACLKRSAAEEEFGKPRLLFRQEYSTPGLQLSPKDALSRIKPSSVKEKEDFSVIHSSPVKDVSVIRASPTKEGFGIHPSSPLKSDNFSVIHGSSVKEDVSSLRYLPSKDYLDFRSAAATKLDYTSHHSSSLKEEDILDLHSVVREDLSNLRSVVASEGIASIHGAAGKRGSSGLHQSVIREENPNKSISSVIKREFSTSAHCADVKQKYLAPPAIDLKPEHTFVGRSSSVKQEFLVSGLRQDNYSDRVFERNTRISEKECLRSAVKSERAEVDYRSLSDIGTQRDYQSVVKYHPVCGNNYSDSKTNSRNVIVSVGHQNSFKSSVLNDRGYSDSKSIVSRAGSHHASYTRNVDALQNPYMPGMSQVEKADKCSLEKTNVSHLSPVELSSGKPQRHTSDSRTSSPRSAADLSSGKDRIKVEDKNVDNVRFDSQESIRIYRDPSLVNTGSSGVSRVDSLHPSLMHPTGISHTAAAAAVYPRVPALAQHNRSPGAAMPPSPLGPYALSSHLLPPPHVAGNTPAANQPQPTSHLDQHASSPVHPQAAYRHMLSQHPLIPAQYSTASGPTVGLDMMWQQKYNPNPWVMAQQYEELRLLERERAMAQERERSRMERQDMERIDREKMEKAEKERHEREKLHKEQQQQWQERERLDRERLDREKEEKECAKRKVQQHFDESLRFASQKQLQQKTMGWSPMSSLPLCKTQPGVGRSSPTVSLPQGAHSQSLHSADHERDKVREKDKERLAARGTTRVHHEHESWAAGVQHRTESATHSSHPHGYPSVEVRASAVQPKELYAMPRSSPHAPSSASHPTNKYAVASPVASTPPGSIPVSQQRSETNFSLYGYQPFQHTYITHAQLKAREEKNSNSMQPIIISSSKHPSSGPQIKQEKEMLYERPPTPGSGRTGSQPGHGTSGKQLKLMHQVQERSSPMYQPLVGSGGAFKPYEYSNSSPAPPAHQSSSSPTVASRLGSSHYPHSQQEQPQNLVKVDHKSSHDQPIALHNHQRYDTRDVRQNVSTPPSTLSRYTPPFSVSKSASPAANSNYSYSLIQQGLVPNPLYIAASHNSSTTVNSSVNVLCNSPSKLSPHAASPPISQQYTRPVAPCSGIGTGTPVCKSSSVSYSISQGRNNSRYSPVGHQATQVVAASTSRTGLQEAHSGSRCHIQVQSTGCRSPSPAHMYSVQPPPAVQSVMPSSPNHSRAACSSPRTNTSSQMQPVQRTPVLSAANTDGSYPSDGQAFPLNLQGSSVAHKRKSSKDFSGKKRQKMSEDNLLPPQLHPQVHPVSSSPLSQVCAPPHLLSTSGPGGPHLNLGADALSANSSVHDGARHGGSDASASTPVNMPDLQSAPLTSLASPVASGLSDSGTPQALIDTSVDAQVSSGKCMKAAVRISFESQSMDMSDEPSRPSSSSSLLCMQTSNASGHEGSEESRTIISPASNMSIALNSSSNTASVSSNHTKLKKAWLQRHSETEDKKIPVDNIKVEGTAAATALGADPSDTKIVSASVKVAITDDIPEIKTEDGGGVVEQESKALKAEAAVEEESTTSASEMEEEVKHVKRKLRISRKIGSSPGSIKRQKIPSSSCDAVEDPAQCRRDKDKKKGAVVEKESQISMRRRGRKTKGRNIPVDDCQKKKTPKPPEKPSVAQLRKTGEPFLQDGPCCEVAPRLPKCRECRMTPHQRSKKMPNIFCRFYAYRKLRYGKNGTILGAGFSEPSDATEEDLRLWLPPVDSPPSDMEVETSKFLLTHVGDQFCDLVEMEREAQSMHMSENTTVTWKRVVQGVREMCDVCETTLFNIHWVCHKCGFVVCIDCYRARKKGLGKGEESPSKDRDEFQWLLCTNRQAHEQEKLMLTQIIASTALWDVGRTLHEVRRKWNIPTYCSCSAKGEQEGKHSANGICKLMSAVTKCFSTEKEPSQVNGVSDSQRSSRKSSKNTSLNGVVKQEDGMSGYSSESGGSPLSWLADVALNSSSKVKEEKKGKSDDDDQNSESQYDHGDGSPESDEEKSENFSTLRELLIRPMGKMGSKSSGADSSSQKTLTSTLDEVISCVIEQRVRKSDKKCKEKQLLHFTRRHQLLRSGRELLPIRSCMLTESSLLYPEIPHVWLGNGKILLLTDSYHSGNMQLFQEQWKRGQPVIVASVGQKLDESLWSPESFSRDFGDMKNDFFNCIGGTLVQNLPMKKFWDGFENSGKRIKDDNGQHMILKLKDWPPSEEFSELLPTRYQDLMKALPLPEYTHRDGIFNMASRLPDCFVRPDLGPRMYSAYGVTSCSKGSTYLHLDVSDAVNVLAYIGKLSESEDLTDEDIMKALDENGCDYQMKKRSEECGWQVGAIWHVYNARDADKIRDLLNKVAEEQGAKCDPHHDPIHYQEWYLDAELRDRLYKEYGVEGYAIAQCLGDALFIPAGSPHQVKNLKSCVKVSEDFVSPESVGHSFFLTQEIRNLSDCPSNPEDRLQIKNIIYHAVKDALALLQSCDPEDSKS